MITGCDDTARGGLPRLNSPLGVVSCQQSRARCASDRTSFALTLRAASISSSYFHHHIPAVEPASTATPHRSAHTQQTFRSTSRRYHFVSLLPCRFEIRDPTIPLDTSDRQQHQPWPKSQPTSHHPSNSSSRNSKNTLASKHSEKLAGISSSASRSLPRALTSWLMGGRVS